MLDIDAPIEPGRGLGGVTLGCPVADLLERQEPLRVVELPGAAEGGETVVIHSFGAIRTWSVRGVVEQVGAFEGYRGRTQDGIGIGSTIADVRAAWGAVRATDAACMIDVPAMPGVGIETTQWTAEEPDAHATIVQLFVHVAEA